MLCIICIVRTVIYSLYMYAIVCVCVRARARARARARERARARAREYILYSLQYIIILYNYT